MLPFVVTSGQEADSLNSAKEKPGKIFVNSFLAPTILIGAGVATMYDRGWYSSYDAYECIQENYPDFHSNLDDYLVFLPAVGVYGLNWAGVKGKNNFLDRSLIYLVSLSLAAATNGIIKGSTDVLRPDGSDYYSFPSNHTAFAFVSATFLHMEYKDESIWYGIAGYSIATATGVLRMLNNEHWMSDVLVGAGIGILTTKVTYLLYPLVKDCLRNRRKEKGTPNLTLLPYASPNNYGFFLSYQIR
jgi:hypothetical protein